MKKNKIKKLLVFIEKYEEIRHPVMAFKDAVDLYLKKNK